LGVREFRCEIKKYMTKVLKLLTFVIRISVGIR